MPKLPPSFDALALIGTSNASWVWKNRVFPLISWIRYDIGPVNATRIGTRTRSMKWVTLTRGLWWNGVGFHYNVKKLPVKWLILLVLNQCISGGPWLDHQAADCCSDVETPRGLHKTPTVATASTLQSPELFESLSRLHFYRVLGYTFCGFLGPHYSRSLSDSCRHLCS